jgi:hypothetical protein
MGVGGQRHAPAALPPGMTRYPLYRRLGRPQGWSGRVLNISPPHRDSIPDRPVKLNLPLALYIAVKACKRCPTECVCLIVCDVVTSKQAA